MRSKNHVCKELKGKMAGQSQPEGQMDPDGVRDRGRAWSAMEAWEVNLTLETTETESMLVVTRGWGRGQQEVTA